MKRYFTLALLLLLICDAMAQNQYEQQFVDYDIDVQLDDEKHLLHGNYRLEYHNNSNDDLHYIYFHLWPNAYKNKTTAYAQQQIRMGSSDFYFTDEANLGAIDSLAFTVDNGTCRLEYDANHVDIAKLHLDTPLKAGEKLVITTPFRVKIPQLHSRLGRVDQYYQITQWYPKPAVYDAEGWHPMPYLDMGEFYSEYGNFEVDITLPANYLVGATGEMMTEEEKIFRQQQEKIGREFEKGQPSAAPLKTVKFVAQNVHDFAWFTSKDFILKQSSVTLASGQEVKTYAYFPPDAGNAWDEATDFLNRSVAFYSEKVGQYPYPHASAVYGGGTGGGMEYPMITSLSNHGNSKKSLDLVITHEVGHNWFYGILGSNERVYPWMDEGMNSFYEAWYMDTYYKEKKSSGEGSGFDGIDQAELVYLLMAKSGVEDPVNTHSDHNKIDIGYYLGAYAKPPMIFNYLKSYMGNNAFNIMMQDYFTQWQFKHPQPADFENLVKKHLPEQNIEWLFDGLIESSGHIDYGLTKLTKTANGWEAIIKNKGDINGPIQIGALVGDSVVYTQWLEGVEDKTVVSLPQGEYDYIMVDPERKMMDINHANNKMKAKQGANLPKVGVKFGLNLHNNDQSNILLAPALGYNEADGFMLGLSIYNSFIIPNRLEFALAPMYGFNSGAMTGTGRVAYNIYPKQGIYSRIKLGLAARSFHFEDNAKWNYHLRYHRISPSLTVEFRPKKQNVYSAIDLRTSYVGEQKGAFTNDGMFEKVENTDTKMFHQLTYERRTWNALRKSGLSFGVEYHEGEDVFANELKYLKTRFTFKNEFFYQKKRSIRLRFFVGAFLDNTHTDRNNNIGYPLNLMSSAPSDYMYNDWYFGRSMATGLATQQIQYREGGMRYVVGAANLANVGRSQSFVTSVNLAADLPFKLPLGLKVRPYFDAGYYADGSDITDIGETIIWTGGVSLSLWKDVIEVNFPVATSSNLKLYTGDYGQQISFVIDLKEFDPWRILRKGKRGEISVTQ